MSENSQAAPMTLPQMIDALRREHADSAVDRKDQVWAGRLAVALFEIDRRLIALETAVEQAANTRGA